MDYVDIFDKGPRKSGTGDAGRCTQQASKKRHSRKRKFRGKVPSKDGGDGISTKKSEPVYLKKVKRV